VAAPDQNADRDYYVDLLLAVMILVVIGTGLVVIFSHQ
jgi:hypothetical protein